MKGGKRRTFRFFGLLLDGFDSEPSNGHSFPFIIGRRLHRSHDDGVARDRPPATRKPVLCQRPVSPPTEADRLTSGMGHPWSSPGALGTINLAKRGQPMNRRCLPRGHGSRLLCLAQLGNLETLVRRKQPKSDPCYGLGNPPFSQSPLLTENRDALNRRYCGDIRL